MLMMASYYRVVVVLVSLAFDDVISGGTGSTI